MWEQSGNSRSYTVYDGEQAVLSLDTQGSAVGVNRLAMHVSVTGVPSLSGTTTYDYGLAASPAARQG